MTALYNSCNDDALPNCSLWTIHEYTPRLDYYTNPTELGWTEEFPLKVQKTTKKTKNKKQKTNKQKQQQQKQGKKGKKKKKKKKRKKEKK